MIQWDVGFFLPWGVRCSVFPASSHIIENEAVLSILLLSPSLEPVGKSSRQERGLGGDVMQEDWSTRLCALRLRRRTGAL